MIEKIFYIFINGITCLLIFSSNAKINLNANPNIFDISMLSVDKSDAFILYLLLLTIL